MTLSPERQLYHALLEKFAKQVKPGSLVNDIGKSDRFDYASYFPGCEFKTVDRDAAKQPDIVCDLERIDSWNESAKADAVLCNGVTEQCDNPFQLLAGLYRLVKSDGRVLFGICLTSYPVYETDNFRFTNRGATRALLQSGFRIEQVHLHGGNSLHPATYGYYICRT